MENPNLYKAKQRNPLKSLLFTVFIDMVGYGILIPIIPLLFADPTSEFFLLSPGTPVSTGLILLGLLIGIYPFMQFLFTPILGQLSDKYGRKKLLALSLFGTSVSYILFAVGILTRNIPLLFISRAFDGITGGNIAIAQAAIADITPPQDRAKRFGLMGAVFGAGFILGPFLGGTLGDRHIVSWFNAATPFIFAAILAMINVGLVLFRMDETLKHRRTAPIHWAQSATNFTRAYTNKHLRYLFFAALLFFAGFTFFTSFFNVFLIERFRFDESAIGIFFAYIGIWIMITQGFINRKIHGKFAEYKIVRVTYVGAAIVILLYFFTTAWWQIFLIAPFMAICIGLSMAYSTSIVSSSVDQSSQGEILGIYTSVQTFAQSIPPIISGFIAAAIFPTAPILVASVVIVAAAVVFFVHYKPVHGEHVAHK